VQIILSIFLLIIFTLKENFEHNLHLKHQMESNGSSPPRSPKRQIPSSAEGDSIDADGSLSRAHDWSGLIIAGGRHFTDEHGRVLLLRGVNVCGHSKLPTLPLNAHLLAEGNYEDKNLSFVGRPFHLDELDEHFQRLRAWGLTFLRVLVTWEAVGVYSLFMLAIFHIESISLTKNATSFSQFRASWSWHI
jgi:hypothetical protein